VRRNRIGKDRERQKEDHIVRLCLGRTLPGISTAWAAHSSASSLTARSESEIRAARRGATTGPCAMNCSRPHSIAGESIKFLSSVKAMSVGVRLEHLP
jgi:hypothetical protein